MSKAKISELESVVEDCARFLELIPLEAISKGLRWFPSDEAIHIGRRAKESANHYLKNHPTRLASS